jgi:DNA-binding PadR family transcriptional regulator
MTDLAKHPQLSPSAYVVLGMILLGRRSGYEIKQTVEMSIRFFWTISPAQIYPSLQMLEHGGLIRGKNDPRGRLPRKSFTVTRAGKSAFEQWLLAAEELPFELRDVGLLKLFFADLAGADQAVKLLETIGNRSEARIVQLQVIRRAADSIATDEGYSFPLATLRLGIAYHKAIVEECGIIRRELTARIRQTGRR